MAHHGRELVAPPAGPAGRTYTCSSPASSPPPYETKPSSHYDGSHSHPVQSVSDRWCYKILTRSRRGEETGYYKSQKGVQNVKRMRASVCWPLSGWIPPPTHSLRRCTLTHSLTRPGVSSMSDKGQTGSRRARVRTAQPAASAADPLCPALTENQDSDSRSQACFWWYKYIPFHPVNIRPATPTANKFINFWVTVWIYCTHNKSVLLCKIMNYNQGTRVYNFLTWSKQKLKSLMVSKTKPGVLSVSMFSIFLKVEKNICWTKSFYSYYSSFWFLFKKINHYRGKNFQQRGQ